MIYMQFLSYMGCVVASDGSRIRSPLELKEIIPFGCFAHSNHLVEINQVGLVGSCELGSYLFEPALESLNGSLNWFHAPISLDELNVAPSIRGHINNTG
jgi:hypothetical protein